MILTKKKKLTVFEEEEKPKMILLERSVYKLFNDSREFNSFGGGEAKNDFFGMKCRKIIKILFYK